MSRRSTNPTGTALVAAGCARWPGIPSRTLARKLFKENKGVWSSIEAARKSVLYRRGRYLTKDVRRSCKDPIRSTAPRRAWNPEKYLPKSDEQAFLPYIVETDRDLRTLVLGDIHVPYHSNSSVRVAFDQGRREDCRLIILNGDTLDFHRLSRFQKDPRARDAKKEVDAVNQLLDAIDDLFPKARKIWKDGNHDERYDHYIAAHAEEVFSLIKEHASLPRLLELDSRGWEYVSEKRPIYLGGLTLIHGHEYPTPVLGPVNAARGLFLRAKDCAMVNHHHQTSEHTDPTIREKIITTWSLGCLCDLHPMYARFNRWNHGFATVNLAKDGTFRVRNHRIHRGVILS
jgi:predicted phosphodiesterase